METNYPGDEQSPEIPPVQPLSTAEDTPAEHPAAVVKDAPVEEAPAVAEPPQESNDAPPSEPSSSSVPESESNLTAEAAPAEAPMEEGAVPVQEGAAASVEGAAAPVQDELMELALASQRARLAPALEERMSALLKDALMGGRAGVARAVEVLPKAPWIVSVRAVEAVWPELTAGFRTQLLAGLGKEETDAARRLRLSLARALFKIDAPVALKVAVAVAKEMRDKDSGALAPKHAQVFSNVFIGRAKPWLGQLPLAELKPAEADVIVHCAVLSVFTIPHPPVTQLGVLKWAQENGRLGKLHENALEALKKGVARWSAKWQGALRKEVAELPDEVIAVLRPLASENPPARREVEAVAEENPPVSDISSDGPAGEREDPTGEPEGSASKPGDIDSDEGDEDADDDADREDDDEEGDEEEEEERERDVRPRKERLVYEPRPQKPAQQQQEGGREQREQRDPQRERPVYTPRNAGGGGGGNQPQKFNLHDAFRQIESHVQSLRSDLAAAQSKLRQKEDDNKRRPEKSTTIIEGERSPEELARLNHQLEARNQELQSRIEEMAQHSEDVATSMGVMSGQPINDTGAQLRTLLALKLQEDFADFVALEKESNDLVIQQHYKGLLQHVFEVLTRLDIPLKSEQGGV